MWLALPLFLATQAHASPAQPARIDAQGAPLVQPLDDEGVKGLRATFHVACTPEKLLSLLWDVRKFRGIFPDIRALEVVKQLNEDAADVRFTVDAVFRESSYTLRRIRSPGAICWHSIAGDVKSIRGSWRVEPTANAGVSRVEYTSFVDVGFFVPTGLVRDVAMRKVDEMARRVRGACAAAP